MGRVITNQPLVAHPDSPDHGITIQCDVGMEGEALTFSFRAEGAVGRLIVPPSRPPQRIDGLWRHTCFEAFLMPAGGQAYAEFNFAPSGAWAAYQFTGHREGMANLPLPSIAIASTHVVHNGIGSLAMTASIPLASCPALPCRLGLAAVTEAQDGSKAYWAVRHPPGSPNFHHPDCFALTLPAPGAA